MVKVIEEGIIKCPIDYQLNELPVEVASQTNTQNAVIFNILAKILNDPLTKDAWNTFTSEIIGKSGLSKYLVAGYFGAKAPSGDASNLWALNPLVHLASGSTGNAIGIEVDVNNEQADGKGSGVTIVSGRSKKPYVGIHVKKGASGANFQTGVFIADSDLPLAINNDAGIGRIHLKTGTAGNRGVLKLWDATAGAWKYAYIDNGAWVIAAAEPT